MSEGGVGLTALMLVTGDEGATIEYVSVSMEDILGYKPEELTGTSVYDIFHPEEIPYLREVHYWALLEERSACVAYMRLLHKHGHFIESCVAYSTVYGHSVATYTRAEDGPRTIQQALTAREVIEVSPSSQGKWGVKRWSQPTPTSQPRLTSTSMINPARNAAELDQPWKLPARHPRTFFFLDRFTNTSRVIFASNASIVNTTSVKGQSFYCIIRPSDRSLVRHYIDTAKAWSPVVRNEKRSGGHGYCRFSILKIPDLPPHGATFPKGTDESERSMPGQEFIPVEGIFTASSDGMMCIVSRLNVKQ